MKTVIVTGAAGNLGREVVKKFLSEKYKVFGTVIPGNVVDFASENFEKVQLDLMSEEDCKRFVESNGEIDIAVLTVGGFAMGDIETTPATDILKQYRINFEATYNIARHLFVQMKKQNHGRIFMIGSKPGLDSGYGKGMVAYALAKSLVFRLAELMNEEGKASNIVTTVIVPGTIDTPQNRSAMPDADFSKWVKASEIANTIHFYSSKEAGSIREPLIKMYGNS